MKILFESSAPRTITGDPMKFFGVNNIPNGSFISVGYLIPPVDARGGSKSTEVFQGGPKTRKYNIPSNDAVLVSYIEQYAGTAFAEKMEEIRQSPKYQKALSDNNDNMIVPFDLGDCRFIKIGRYNINWRNEDKNADDWENRTEKLWGLRKKYGFGKDEDEYAETDWRRKPKYNGTGIMPKLGRQITDEDDPTEYLDSDEISRRNANAKWASPKEGIPTYLSTGYGLYAHHDGNGRLAIRQQVAQVRPGSSRWYFVNEEGDMTEISRECANWLCSAYKQQKNEVEAMEADEKAYVAELDKLEKLNDSQIKQLVLDRVLYMVGATKKPDGTREPIAYINDESIYVDYPYLDPDAMNGVISQWVKVSTKDVVELNEAMFTGKFKSAKLNELLNRTIKSSLNKLNESYDPETIIYETFDEYDNPLSIAVEDWEVYTKDGQLITHVALLDGDNITFWNGDPEIDDYAEEIGLDDHDSLIAEFGKLFAEDMGIYESSKTIKYRRKLNESENTDKKYMNLLDFLMKEGKLNPNQPFDKCMDKIELVVKGWKNKNEWEDEQVDEIMKYILNPKFTAVKTSKGYELSLKAGSKTIKWSI